MNKIVFYDTETTGLPVWKEPSESEKQPHLVQLSAIQCNAETREILQRIDLIVRPNGWEIPQEVVDIHGITTEKAMDVGVTELGAITLLTDICLRDNSIRVAHNRTFDQRIIRIGLKRYKVPEPIIEAWAEKEDHECTMLMAKPIMKLPPKGKFGWKNPKLEDAYKYFCEKDLGENAHSSIFDTEACMEIYFAIKSKENKKICSSCGKEFETEHQFCDDCIPF